MTQTLKKISQYVFYELQILVSYMDIHNGWCKSQSDSLEMHNQSNAFASNFKIKTESDQMHQLNSEVK